MKTNILFLSYLAQFFLEWETFQTKVVEKIKTHILPSVPFPWKSCSLWNHVEKCGTTRQVTDNRQYNMAHAHFMLDNWGYRHTLRIFNIYCFSAATMVTRTRLNVMFLHTMPVFRLFTYIFCNLSTELNLCCCDPVFVFVQVLLWECRYNKNYTTEAVLSIWVMMEHETVTL
jgi:hypothetical protein